MEFAIGKIIYISGKQSRIQVLFYSKNGYWTNNDLQEHFPTLGRVFAPNLGGDFPNIAEHDIVKFTYAENPNESVMSDGKDLYIFPSKKDGGKIWNCPRVLELNPDTIYNRTQISEKKEQVFFFRKNGASTCICGPIWSTNSEPLKGKEVKGWSYRTNYDTVSIDGKTYLVEDISEFTSKEHKTEIDCMSALQLKEWFKIKLDTLLTPEQLKQIQIKIKNIESGEDNDLLSKERFARIKKGLSAFSFDWSEIKNLSEIYGFKKLIDDSIQSNIELILKAEKTTIDIRRAEINIEREKLESDFSEYKSRCISEKTRIQKKLEEETNQLSAKLEEFHSLENKLKNLDSRREELIEYIKIQAGLFNTTSSTAALELSMPLEYIIKCDEAEEVSSTNQEEFIQMVNNLLEIPTPWLTTRLLKKLHEEYASMVEDIRTGIFLVAVCGNSVYQLVQPAPNWLTFKDFWNNSLQNIWNSAHKNPDVWHFLLIENFNVASPECWGKPLWNIIDGKSKKIPGSEFDEYPRNLRIIVSMANYENDDNDAIGLPTRVGESWFCIPNIAWSENSRWDELDDVQSLGINEDFFYPVK